MDQAWWLHPEEGVSVTIGHRLARDFDHMTKALGHQKTKTLEAMLKNRVGGRGRAMQNLAQRADIAACGLGSLGDPVQKSTARIIRRTGCFDGELIAGRFVDSDNVSERPARVDGNT